MAQCQMTECQKAECQMAECQKAGCQLAECQNTGESYFYIVGQSIRLDVSVEKYSLSSEDCMYDKKKISIQKN